MSLLGRVYGGGELGVEVNDRALISTGNALGSVLSTREKLYYAFSTNTVGRDWDTKTRCPENGNSFHGIKQYIISLIIPGTLQVFHINSGEMTGNGFWRKYSIKLAVELL